MRADVVVTGADVRGLVAESVTHRYGAGPDVLAGVDLHVAPGEAVALMGPSGSGKTTLLSILGLLTTPTAGRVLIDGEPVLARRRSWVRSELYAWVFQTVNVLGPRTALDNTSLGLLVAGVSRREADPVARQALATVGLEERADDTVTDLSGGELQRVCIARALASNARFVLADEPTGQLDHATSMGVLDALWQARTEATSLIVASHDPAVAARCDRVISLVDGRVVSQP